MTKQEKEKAVNEIAQTILYIKDCNATDAPKLFAESVCIAQFACNVGLITPVAFEILVFRAKTFLDEREKELRDKATLTAKKEC